MSPRRPRGPDPVGGPPVAPDGAEPAGMDGEAGGDGDDARGRNEPGARKSKSQKKREAHALYDVGVRLVEMSDHALSAVPLDAPLREAVLTCRPLKKNARMRQLRLIAKLLRHGDAEPIVARVSEAQAVHGQSVASEQANEAWRRRLLSEGDAALTELLDAHPGADSGQLRRLVREASRSPEGPRTVRARRELLRAIRALRAGPPAPPVPMD